MLSLSQPLGPYSGFINGYHISVERRGTTDVDLAVSAALNALEEQLDSVTIRYAKSIGQLTRCWHYVAEVNYD
jgi:hypothetical protein